MAGRSSTLVKQVLGVCLEAEAPSGGSFSSDAQGDRAYSLRLLLRVTGHTASTQGDRAYSLRLLRFT